MVSAHFSYNREPPDSEVFATTEFGTWQSSARARSASAGHFSTIDSTGVVYSAYASGLSQTSFNGTGSSTLVLTFSIDGPMQWTLDYMFNPLPSERLWHSLRRSGTNLNEFANVQWFSGYRVPVSTNGYLDAGTYRLEFNTTMFTNGAHEEISFAMNVPAPGCLSIVLASPLAFRRRR